MAATIGLNARESFADINYYRLFKGVAYEQTSDVPPTVPLSYGGNVDVIFDNPADLTGGQVDSSSPLSPMVFSMVSPTYFGYGRSFNTLAELDASFPNGTTYNYAISGGILGTQSASLTTPVTNLFPSAIPFLTGSVYSQLQGMHPNAPFLFTWNGYGPAPGITSPGTFFSIFRVSDGQFAFGVSGNQLLTSSLIPANTLLGGTQYVATLVYSARVVQTNAGFAGATSEVAFDLSTEIEFTTAVPEASTLFMTSMGLVGLLVIIRCRRRANFEPDAR